MSKLYTTKDLFLFTSTQAWNFVHKPFSGKKVRAKGSWNVLLICPTFRSFHYRSCGKDYTSTGCMQITYIMFKALWVIYQQRIHFIFSDSFSLRVCARPHFKHICNFPNIKNLFLSLKYAKQKLAFFPLVLSLPNHWS